MKTSAVLWLFLAPGMLCLTACATYAEYPWGDYYWESPRHYNPAEVQDDYYHDTGMHMQRGAGEELTPESSAPQ